MEKEISFVELVSKILLLLKRHCIKYIIILVLFLVFVFVNFNKQNKTYRELYYIYSEYFSKQELTSLFDMMNRNIEFNNKISSQLFKDVSVFENVKHISISEVSEDLIYSILRFETQDSNKIEAIKNNILYFLLNNDYSKIKINKLFNKNDFLYKQFNRYDTIFKQNLKVEVEKKNYAYSSNDKGYVELYNSLYLSKVILDDIKNDKLIIIYNHLSTKGHKDDFWLFQILYFIALMLLTTIVFGMYDLVRFARRNESLIRDSRNE